jgi:DNA repair protein RadC
MWRTICLPPNKNRERLSLIAGSFFYICLSATGKQLRGVVIMVRMIKYKTKLTEDKRVTLEKEISVNRPDMVSVIRSPEDAVSVGKGFLRVHEESEEYLYMICMNTKNKIIGVFEVSHGNVNSSIFGVREIFQKALLANAVSIIVMHNHPSGDPNPSREDIEVTKRLVEAGKIIGVNVLDHIIVGESYTSLKEKGYV